MLNLSPFVAERLVVTDQTCEERLLLLEKATYAIKGVRPRIRDKQEPVRLADEYHGEPGKSSVKAAADGTLAKPATDFVLTGSAYTTAKDKTQVDVRLKVGSREKIVRVFGERRWEKGMVFTKAT